MDRPDRLHFVAQKAGCDIQTVTHNYLTLDEWESIDKVEYREPLDLNDFNFMEG